MYNEGNNGMCHLIKPDKTHTNIYELYTSERDDNQECFQNIQTKKKIIYIPSHATALSGFTVSHSRESIPFFHINPNKQLNQSLLFVFRIHISYPYDETKTNMFSLE